jgi:hypothetical protein
MSSRQQEKEQRRQERLEREAAERKAAARKKRLGVVLAGVLGVLVLAGAAVAIISATGGNDEQEVSGNSGDAADITLPPQEETDLQAAAKAAGCKVETVPYAGAGHEDKEFKASDYNSNPPTSGAHNPAWYEDGIYEPGTTPKLGELVHTLEHGRINIQYKPGSPPRVVQQLEALYDEMSEGYHLMLYENTTGMKEAVAATAWTQKLGCPEMNDKVFDAIRTFRARYIDKGPERVP